MLPSFTQNVFAFILSLFDAPPPHLNRTDYYYLFMWDAYLAQHPNTQRNLMMDDLREQWMHMTAEERYPFEVMADQDELEFKQKMKEVDPSYDMSQRRIHRRMYDCNAFNIGELDRGHYRPPLFYYLYTHIVNYHRKHQGIRTI